MFLDHFFGDWGSKKIKTPLAARWILDVFGTFVNVFGAENFEKARSGTVVFGCFFEGFFVFVVPKS